MHTVEQVYAIIGGEVRGVGAEDVAVEETYGRVLAEGVVMTGDSPPFDRSQLDGFAVRSEDAVAGARLRIIGRQEAGGAIWRGEVGRGECIGINTGAIFPAGADAVLMVEYSRVAGEYVEVKRAVSAGYGIQRRGADARAGQEVLPAGSKLHAAALAAAVLAGAGKVSVMRKVKVAVLTTGDELDDKETRRQGDKEMGRIWNSNGPMLRAMVAEALGSGGEVLDLGVCGDEEAELRKRLRRGLKEADVVVVTGGMSMGTKDLVPGVLKGLGVGFHVEKVRMKPGKPFVFGTTTENGQKRYVAGLPGNPVSAFVTFQLFVREVLRRLMGEKERERLVMAEAGGDFEANGEREFYQPCVLRRHGAVLVAEGLKWRGSGDVFTVAKAQGLVRRAAGAAAVKAGEMVEVVVLGEGEG